MSDLKAYPGSCHCGAVQYLVKLKFPPSPPISPPTPNLNSIRIYKCNCSTCHKMSMFHLRPITPADDYILTSPASIADLGEYRCFEKKHGWYFCRTCGVRVLGLGGAWEQVDLDVAAWAGTKKAGDEQDNVQKVWRTTGEPVELEHDGVKVQRPFYLSVNAATLEMDGEVDLKMWHEMGWVMYVECRREDGSPARFGEPYEGGMY